MEFDWSIFTPTGTHPDEVAESFEDPFSLRLMPDAGAIADQSRFFCLGMSLRKKALFSVYSSDGKQIRILASREMTEEELFFYNRKTRESL
ncbi:MAG: hypothetical protein PHD76_10360 [Methylacidiphilales bacterium]|nr:hypothetical protein [Candidatus Methylacidiphilales bacterium]